MRRPRTIPPAAVLAVVALLALVTACGADGPEIGADGPTPTDGATAPDDGGEPMDDPDVPERHREATRAAIDDLAERAGADPGEIEVVTVQDVTWRDGSIGCPEPDAMYTQALVDGYRIELEAGGDTYHYHGADGEPPFHCPDDRRQEPHAADR